MYDVHSFHVAIFAEFDDSLTGEVRLLSATASAPAQAGSNLVRKASLLWSDVVLAAPVGTRTLGTHIRCLAAAPAQLKGHAVGSLDSLDLVRHQRPRALEADA